MNNDLQKKIKLSIKNIESALVSKNYDKAISDSVESRLTAEEVKNTVESYGGEITTAPDEYFRELYPIEIKNSAPTRYALDFDLWVNGKRSDLTLSLTLIPDKEGNFSVSVDDLYVL